jgi:hypothetical protein
MTPTTYSLPRGSDPASLTTDVPAPSDTVTRPDRAATAPRRRATATGVPLRRWAIVRRLAPSLRTVIVPGSS